MSLPGKSPHQAAEPPTEDTLQARIQELTASETRLRELLQADPFSILISTLAGDVTYMNQPLLDLLGYTSAQVESGQIRWDKLTPPEFAARDAQALQELRQTGRCRTYKKELLARNGRRVPILLGASVISDGQNHAEIAIFITDLSELEHARQEIQEKSAWAALSDERSRQLLRSNPFGIMVGTPDGRIGYMNPSLRSLLDESQDEIERGRYSWIEATPPEWLPADRAAIAEAYTFGNSRVFEKEFFDRHGNRVPVLVGLTLIPNLEGGSDLAAFVTDLTALKRTQDELEQSRRKLDEQLALMETIYRTAPVSLGYYDCTPDFRLIYGNDALAELVQQPKENILGKPLLEFVTVPQVIDLFKQVASGQSIQNRLIEASFEDAPNEKRVWRASYTPVFAADGSVQGISTTSTEITSQLKSADALRESEKLAAVGRLASSISHEINNPLEAITNLLYLARYEEDEATRNEYLDTAQHELARVSQIATQTLRFHRQPGTPIPLLAQELMEPVLALYSGRLVNSGIQIERRYRSQQPFSCMEGDIRQVLNNLIGNAIDAMRQGGTLQIRTSDFHHPITNKPYAAITVADSGPGMNEETLHRLFEAFYTTKGIHGTGLGLWISRDIVTKHHGSLRVRSAQQGTWRGSVFRLELPVTPPGSESASVQ